MLLLSSLILGLSTLFYLPLAKKFNIVDKPTIRGAHTEVTIRGLGIIFIVAGLLVCYYTNAYYYYLWIGFFLIGVISFWDDVRSLPNRVRIAIHFIANTLLLLQLNEHFKLQWWFFPVLLILTVGIVNAYNFMDGINGITGAYSLINFGFLFSILNSHLHLVSDEFFYPVLIALFIFLFLNFRRKAIGFGGDVGSITLAYLLVFLLLMLIFYTQNWKYMFFLGLYGIDTIYTLLYRLLKGENIFQAHKVHFFQLLIHQYKWPHLLVSIVYAVIQFFWNILIITADSWILSIFFVPVTILGVVHIYRYKKGLAIGQKDSSTK